MTQQAKVAHRREYGVQRRQLPQEEVRWIPDGLKVGSMSEGTFDATLLTVAGAL